MSSKYPEEFEFDLNPDGSRNVPVWRGTYLLILFAIAGIVVYFFVSAPKEGRPVEAKLYALDLQFQIAAYKVFPGVEIDEITCDTSRAPQSGSDEGIILNEGDRFPCVYAEVRADGRTVEHTFHIQVTHTELRPRRHRPTRQVYFLEARYIRPSPDAETPEGWQP